MCPICGAKMRLSTIEPGEPTHAERMTFRCDCGFEYRQSYRVAAERAL